MELKEAMKTHEFNGGKIDILELLGIEIKDNHFEEKYYIDKIENLSNGNYFISDLDGTFFRGMLSKETFSLFIKFIKKQDLLNFDSEIFKEFLDDIKYFNELEKKAYNKIIDYNDYINAGTFLLFKYEKLINWQDFLYYLEKYFVGKEKVNPFRYSLSKMKLVLEKGDNFCFVSGAPHFILDIYLRLLKSFIEREFGKNYDNKIFGFGTYIGLEEKKCIGLFGKTFKDNFIKQLKKIGKIENVVGGMGDTGSDYGISYNLDEGEFCFMNPEQKVIEKFDELFDPNIKYKFIFERKDMIFKMEKKYINIIKI